ncbi:MAG: ABC transporter permease [Bacteroidetes bacterium]|nr:MAG: ABC transporter permease [Bacteroidota bacterium]
MFDIDKWQEIFATIGKNPLRTFLTSFSVGWGIFMLILLLGLGKGLENGVRGEFQGDAVNSIWMWAGQTTLAHEGLKPGRNIRFTNEDYEALKRRLPPNTHITGRFWIPGGVEVVYGTEAGDYGVRCVHPDHQILENTGLYQGRYINETDIKEYRKVAIIGKAIQEEFMNGADVVGEYIKINGIPFRIVGVYHEYGDEGEEDAIYLPITTAQRTFNGQQYINQIMFTVGNASVAESKIIEKEVRLMMSERHHFDPEDPRAVNIRNMVEQFQQFMNVMTGIQVFIWIIAGGTILAGIIGVSNIMIIVVKERTLEFGIRKALGATPWSIVSLILQESIFITTLAGYIGLLLGMGLLELIGPAISEGVEIFGAPEINLNIALTALILLVIAGSVAGLIPAMKAANIRPIEALRAE